MIYFLHGNDGGRARAKVRELISTLQKKKPDASFFKMDAENWDESLLREYAASQGLFESRYIVFLDHICDDKDIKDIFLDKMKELGESSNVFFILERKLDKASGAKIEKRAEKTIEFKLAETAPKKEFNAFGLADALGRRDTKNMWILYRVAIDRGEAPEALHGMMFWKVKTMIVNSYPGAYSKDELYNLADKLVTVVHDSRRGFHEMETGVEALLLSI